MDDLTNPFEPGAGIRPPELAGREDLIKTINISMQRLQKGKVGQSQILVGLRGVGKTVLLNHFLEEAKNFGCHDLYIEAKENEGLASQIIPLIHSMLKGLSHFEQIKDMVGSAMGAIASFIQTFKMEYSGLSISVKPELGVADSGNLETDFAVLFDHIGRLLLKLEKSCVIFIDEIQYLKKQDISALIFALHRAGQRGYPIMLVGAGLPQVRGNCGNAKSYSERLFKFIKVDALEDDASKQAIRVPIENENEHISNEALDRLYQYTCGYPYFLQEWGKQVWAVAEESPISVDDVEKATKLAIDDLDESFFRVRLDRLTRKEQEYVHAMAEIGAGPYRSNEVAERLDTDINKLGTFRANIIHKGMIYSPSYGDIDFTVPMFDQFLRREKFRSDS